MRAVPQCSRILLRKNFKVVKSRRATPSQAPTACYTRLEIAYSAPLSAIVGVIFYILKIINTTRNPSAKVLCRTRPKQIAIVVDFKMLMKFH